jgi:hypothetical protein
MSTRELDNLAKTGLLKAEPGNRTEFDGLVESGRKRLADAARIELTAESRFDLAYSAAHAFSLAAMRWHGYRPTKRYVVFQALRHTLGVKTETWRVLDKCHSQRNLLEYDGTFDVDIQLLAELLKASEVVYRAVKGLGPVPPKASTGRTRL